MFERVPFEGKHLDRMIEQEINAGWRDKFKVPGIREWLETQNSVTGLWKGEPMVCGGITEYWPGRGHLWTVLDARSKDCFIPVFRGIKSWISGTLVKDFHRIEVSIPCGFRLGCRRAEMLGFRLECGYAEGYLPGGEDAAVYVMTRKRGG